MQGLQVGTGVDWLPYVTSRWTKEAGKEELEAEGGFDLFYKITPNLTATLTYNTDFAETEVDNRRVNLTRFPIMYPEKRDLFWKARRTLPLPLVPAFHSRRIGLTSDRQRMNIVGGAKSLAVKADSVSECSECIWTILEHWTQRKFSLAASRKIFSKSPKLGRSSHMETHKPT